MIQNQIRRLEQLKAELLTAKTAESVDAIRMSRVTKPAIIQDRTSATDFLDRWLNGEVDLPKEQGFDAQLKQRQSAAGTEETSSDSNRGREEAEKVSSESALAAFLQGCPSSSFPIYMYTLTDTPISHR